MPSSDLLSVPLIVIGGATVVAGGWVLWATRRAGGGGESTTRPEDTSRNGHQSPASDRTPGSLSDPTRYSLAVVLIVIGYHLVAWGIPSTWGTPIAVPRQWWFAVIGLGAAWAGLSVLLDRLENRPGS